MKDDVRDASQHGGVSAELVRELDGMWAADLREVVKRAGEADPPDEALIAAAGALAYKHARSAFEVDSREYAAVVELAFPRAELPVVAPGGDAL